jgi:hypothetical protein
MCCFQLKALLLLLRYATPARDLVHSKAVKGETGTPKLHPAEPRHSQIAAPISIETLRLS